MLMLREEESLLLLRKKVAVETSSARAELFAVPTLSSFAASGCFPDLSSFVPSFSPREHLRNLLLLRAVPHDSSAVA